jgi:hypothetical protein
LPEEAMTLKKNAYFIYKCFILNSVAGRKKAGKKRLWFSDIKSFLDMQWGNDRGIHATIDKAFKEMQSKGLVSGYTWNKNYTKERQYVLTFEYGKNEGGEKQDGRDEVLKIP